MTNAITNATSSVEILHGKEPNELPDLELQAYDTGPNTIIAACTGPDDGLTAVRRSRLHLSAGPDADIDFIDTAQEDPGERKSAVTKTPAQLRYRYHQQQLKQRQSAACAATSSMTVAIDQNANKSTSNVTGIRPRKLSKSENVADFQIHQLKTEPNAKGTINVVVSMISTTRVPSLTAEKHFNGDVTISTTNKLNENVKENISPNDSAMHEEFAGVSNWKLENENAYGLSVSLYEKNFITQQSQGSPIADCYGIVARSNSIAMALADGVNWGKCSLAACVHSGYFIRNMFAIVSIGEGARLAARSAVQGSLEYLDTAVFGQVAGGMATTTREVFVSLLRSFWSAHACILETGGALTTLTVAVILPLGGEQSGKSIVCSCNVGDSLGYVYSKRYGVREFTQGSHDVNSMRDMRDALGALGPVDGNKPELGNLTLSMTVVEPGDVVFLTSDGISDNFDPVVGKFAEPFNSTAAAIEQAAKPPSSARTNQQLAPKRQNKSASSLNKKQVTLSDAHHPLQKSDSQPIRSGRRLKTEATTSSNGSHVATNSSAQNRPKFSRSHTVIESSRVRLTKEPSIKYPVSAAGLPLVTGSQRHALTLLRLEDLLSYGINGSLQPCTSARKLCHLLVDFAKMITAAKRKMLEQRELFYKPVMSVAPPESATGHSAGVIKTEVEMNRIQQRAARKRVVDGQTFALLPGKWNLIE